MLNGVGCLSKAQSSNDLFFHKFESKEENVQMYSSDLKKLWGQIPVLMTEALEEKQTYPQIANTVHLGEI